MAARILIIDDDERLTEMVAGYLKARGFAVECRADARSGLLALEGGNVDALILDVMLPDIDGFEVCRRVRAGSDVPILMLTARGDATDRVVGLEIGADDYLPKPFDPRELLARLGAVLRRSRRAFAEPSAPLRFGRLTIDQQSREVRLDGRPRELTGRQFDLLLLLAAEGRTGPDAASRSWRRSGARDGTASIAASTFTCRAFATPSRTTPNTRASCGPFAARAICFRPRSIASTLEADPSSEAAAVSPAVRRAVGQRACLRGGGGRGVSIPARFSGAAG